jgi:hypothetical protein
MPPDSILFRYIHVRALAVRGEPGEQRNAKIILGKMEQEYPGIRQAAAQFDQAQRAERTQGVGAPRKAGPAAGEDPIWWDTLFRYAGQAYENAKGFAETVGNVTVGRELAQHVKSSTKMGRSGNLILSLRLPASVLQKLHRLNLVQQRSFRDALHAMLNEELDAIFGSDD